VKLLKSKLGFAILRFAIVLLLLKGCANSIPFAIPPDTVTAWYVSIVQQPTQTIFEDPHAMIVNNRISLTNVHDPTMIKAAINYECVWVTYFAY
jgi:hypothetical protein